MNKLINIKFYVSEFNYLFIAKNAVCILFEKLTSYIYGIYIFRPGIIRKSNFFKFSFWLFLFKLKIILLIKKKKSVNVSTMGQEIKRAYAQSPIHLLK